MDILPEAVAKLGTPGRANWDLFYSRGIAYELIGMTREAYEDYKSAVTLKPDWAEASAQLQRFSVVRRPTAAS